MKPLGFSLEEMMELLQVLDGLEDAPTGPDSPRLRDELAAFIADAEERRGKLVAHLSMADEFLGMLRRR